ncbi:pyridoxamine 5'-phosphate oxidase family protein [Phreatobacter sp.]|uniref:pyridoxamine 5'-phosphate oxidase family protein n=1 Tax=Phreatobacter sp. TaxID=1966341 RepID=UPI003F6FADC9
MWIDSEAALKALYGPASETSLAKEVPALTPQYRALVEASPFCVLATAGPEGLDATPRGDPPGFIRVLDERTLFIPDRRGNNRIDSLLNIVRDPRLALLLLVPGVAETLRINGRGRITTDPALLEPATVDGKAPASGLVIAIESVYFQCAKALVRSRLWDPEARRERSDLPSPGQMLKGAKSGIDAEAYDQALPARMKATLY